MRILPTTTRFPTGCWNTPSTLVRRSLPAGVCRTFYGRVTMKPSGSGAESKHFGSRRSDDLTCWMTRNDLGQSAGIADQAMKVFSRKEPTIRRKLAFLAGLGMAALVMLGVLVFSFYFCWSLRFDLKQVGEIPERSWIYDMDGKLYTRLYGENRV